MAVGVVPIPVELSLVLAAQREDIKCVEMVRRLGEEDETASKQFLVTDVGTLALVGSRHGLPFLKPVLPKSIAYDVTMTYHLHLGHAAAEATLNAVRADFHLWSNERMSMIEAIKSCQQCQEAADLRTPTPNGAILKAAKFNDFVSLDLLSLPPSPQGHVAALVIVDHATRFSAAAPLMNKKAKEVFSALNLAWIDVHGKPAAIHMDNGPEFVDADTSSHLKAMGIKLEYTTPYNPQANGIVERLNRDLIAELRRMCERRADWPAHLQAAITAHNMRSTRATGHTPIWLAGGADGLAGHLGGVYKASSKRIQGQQRADMAEVASRAARHQLAVEAEAKQDKRLRRLQRGAWVYVRVPRLKIEGTAYSKLTRPWEGPYIILRRNNAFTVLVQPVAGGVARKAHVADIKKFIGDETAPASQEPVPAQAGPTRASTRRWYPNAILPNKNVPEQHVAEPQAPVQEQSAAPAAANVCHEREQRASQQQNQQTTPNPEVARGLPARAEIPMAQPPRNDEQQGAQRVDNEDQHQGDVLKAFFQSLVSKKSAAIPSTQQDNEGSHREARPANAQALDEHGERFTRPGRGAKRTESFADESARKLAEEAEARKIARAGRELNSKQDGKK